ncbi:8-oxo-dGTP diphosphatase [Thiohalospira halophila DSM 15071]|uniref:8-oxo-dGTP diphosphatase n=1 Tax=Thiohalospira halophila DSM 15071 TaxID=1123397 RepID=A0A1I1NIE2_9GAMM|nr:NUDIX hydrolase [Thiohalospira halophila]SFC97474.1 8-oxo-dGTP diphosphatase [Thiohalospira halophila DSM 15071]
MPAPETPNLAADCIIEVTDREGPAIVLIERRNEPAGWALPGGFVDVGETVEAAAVREAAEETGLAVTLEGLLGLYSAPDRDPRGHTVSAVYIARATGEPEGRDDARAAAVVDPRHPPRPLAFDHDRILADYCSIRLPS